jgi:hypothetical protein
MLINATFAFASNATQTDKTQFTDAVNTVIANFENTFTNSNITLNVVFAYGEKYLSNTSTSITYQPMANATATGTFGLGSNWTQFDPLSYSTVLSTLQTKDDTLQPTAYATLPTAASNPFANDTLWLTTAQEKALGFSTNSSVAGYDGVVGIISNEELQAGGFTADWTKAAPANANQYYMLGTIEHELTEVMGRFAFDGTNAINNAPSYTLMDLFRYSAAGVRQTTDGNPAYFSTADGKNTYYYWNNPALAKGDLGDWAPSGPNGANPTGNDAFLNISNPGVVNEVSAYDLNLMNVLGWDLSPESYVTAADIQNYYLAITRTALPLSDATTVVHQIHAGLLTEEKYVDGLLSQVVDTTIPAVAVEASMYGAVGTSSEITMLATQFLPGQVAFALANHFNPTVVSTEALGPAFAFGNENHSTAFATNFGPGNASMPNSTAGDAAFATAAASTIFGSASTPNLVNAIDSWLTNWKGFYTSHGIPGIANPSAAQIDLAARGAAWGDAVGLAIDNNLGTLKGSAIYYLANAAAHGGAQGSASLAEHPDTVAGSAPIHDTAVQLTGLAAHVDHPLLG